MRRAVSSWNKRPQESKYSCKYGVHTNYSMYDYQILHFCRHPMAWNAPAQHHRMHPNRAGSLGDEADDAENLRRSMPELHSPALTSSILGLTRIIAATASSQEHEQFLHPSQTQPYIANRPLGTRPPNRRTTHRAKQTDSTPLTCMSLSSVSPSCPKTAPRPRPPDHARANNKIHTQA